MPESRDYRRDGDDVVVKFMPNCKRCGRPHKNVRFKQIEPPYPTRIIDGQEFEMNFQAICPTNGEAILGTFPIGEDPLPPLIQALVWPEGKGPHRVVPPAYRSSQEESPLEVFVGLLLTLLLSPALLIYMAAEHLPGRISYRALEIMTYSGKVVTALAFSIMVIAISRDSAGLAIISALVGTWFAVSTLLWWAMLEGAGEMGAALGRSLFGTPKPS